MRQEGHILLQVAEDPTKQHLRSSHVQIQDTHKHQNRRTKTLGSTCVVPCCLVGCVAHCCRQGQGETNNLSHFHLALWEDVCQSGDLVLMTGTRAASESVSREDPIASI